MGEIYPEGYSEKQYDKKTKLQKSIHLIKFGWNNRMLFGLLRAMVYLRILMIVARIKYILNKK